MTINPPTNVVEADTSTKVKVDWHKLEASARYVRRNGWEHRLIPTELAAIPDDVVVTDKLQQILTWSMIPGNSWSYQPPRINGNSEKPAKDARISIDVQSPEDGVTTHTSNASSASIASFRTSSSHLTPIPPHHHSPILDSEKSFKSKLLSKIGLNKTEERASATSGKVATMTAECTSCFEELPEQEMTRLKTCRHWYCKECLSMLIMTAMATEASFPPKCCLSPIPLKQILKALSTAQRETFQQKATEYAVPAADRWYCPNKDCLKWIPAAKLKSNRDNCYDCPHCAVKLCKFCRGPAHPRGTECPEDFGLSATLETAEIEGWQRCYKCRHLVEHNKGCRHMTCWCGAEFCYVCGLRWQTCGCTETDAANKRAGVHQRRLDRAAQIDTEAEEIAQAIREIEEMELREAEERRLEEERRQREEEEQLLRLEAERQAEEVRKREEAEQAERDLKNTLMSSFREEFDLMMTTYQNIMKFQLAAINARHETEDARLASMNIEEEEAAKHGFDVVAGVLEKNSKKRRDRLTSNHKSELQALEDKQQEEEDDLFLQVQMRLKGKPNRESRMERMLVEIHKQQEEEAKQLEEKHKIQLEDIDKQLVVDTEGVQRWYENKVQDAQDKQASALQRFGFTVGADRQYFELVTERRLLMLSLHNTTALVNIDGGEEPIGLTEFDASKVRPSLPELDDGEPGPSGIKRGPQLVMTPHGPLQVHRESPKHQTLPSSSVHQDKTSEVHTTSTSHLNSQSTSGQPQPFRPPIPGSFPVDNTLTNMQHHVPAPPPPPRTRPPLPPQVYSQPPHALSSDIPPTMSRKPVCQNRSVPTYQQLPPVRPHEPLSSNPSDYQQLPISLQIRPPPSRSCIYNPRPPPPGALQSQSQREQQYKPFKPQAQPHKPQSTIPPPISSDLANAAARSATAMVTAAMSSKGTYEEKGTGSPVSPITPVVEKSLMPPPLSMKKSKWGFMRPKELTEAEMKRRMRASVGDAFG